MIHHNSQIHKAIKHDHHIINHTTPSIQQIDHHQYRIPDINKNFKQFNNNLQCKPKKIGRKIKYKRPIFEKKCGIQQPEINGLQKKEQIESIYNSLSQQFQLKNCQNQQIYFRDQEIKKIKEYLETGIKKGRAGILILSGLPGIGKSLSLEYSIREITKKYNKLCKKTQTRKIGIVNINGMNEIQNIYQRILIQLIDHRKTADINDNIIQKYQNSEIVLDSLYRKQEIHKNIKMIPKINQKIKRVLIIVIDEIDMLFSQRNEIKSNEIIFYNLLEWSQLENSRLILIGISNQLNFQTSLQNKIKSRMQNNFIIFKPYSYEQIIEILKSKFDRIYNPFTKVIEEEQFRYLALKFNLYSSDIRLLIELMKNCIQDVHDLFINGFEKNQKQIDIVQIDNQIIQKNYSKIWSHGLMIRKTIQNMEQQQQLSLVAILIEQKQQQHVLLKEAMKRINLINGVLGNESYHNYDSFQMVIQQSISCKMVSYSFQFLKGFREILVSLNIGRHELIDSIQDQPYFYKIEQFI